MGDDILEAFTRLCDTGDLNEQTLVAISEFVCVLYCPKGVAIKRLKDLRWYLFCKQMAERDRLPPTEEALKQHILRAKLQAVVWSQAHLPNQELPNPLIHGWKMDGIHYKPNTTMLKPAPDAILEMVLCICKRSKCTSERCSCRANV